MSVQAHASRWVDWLLGVALTASAAGFLVGTGLEPEIALPGTLGIALAVSMARRAWRRRRDGEGALPPGELEDRLAILDARIRELEGIAHQVYELEERLEFSERLLLERSQQPANGEQ